MPEVIRFPRLLCTQLHAQLVESDLYVQKDLTRLKFRNSFVSVSYTFDSSVINHNWVCPESSTLMVSLDVKSSHFRVSFLNKIYPCSISWLISKPFREFWSIWTLHKPLFFSPISKLGEVSNKAKMIVDFEVSNHAWTNSSLRIWLRCSLTTN